MQNFQFFSARRLKQIDKMASIKFKMPPIILMENAGRSVAQVIMQKFPNMKFIYCIAGKGNNGGDGLVAARYLSNNGYKVIVIMPFGSPQSKESISHINLDMLRALRSVKVTCDLSILNKCRVSGVLVDALYGIGLSRKLDISACRVINFVNNISGKKNLRVFSVDIPSGLNPDTGKPYPLAVVADYTVTFGFMKSGFKSPESRYFTGSITLVDIGYPAQGGIWGHTLNK